MINTFIRDFKKELSFAHLIRRHLSFPQKVVELAPFLHFLLMTLLALLSTHAKLRWLLLPAFVLFADTFLHAFIKSKRSLIGYLVHKREELILKTLLDNNKVKKVNKTFYMTYAQYRQREIKKWLKGKCAKTVLETIKHRENLQLTRVLFFLGALSIIAYDQINTILSIVSRFYEPIAGGSSSVDSTHEMSLVIVSQGVLALLGAFILASPYLFVKVYLDFQSSSLRTLRTLVENIAIGK